MSAPIRRDDLAERLADLERRLATVERAARLPSASYRFPGTLKYLDDAGNVLFWFGGLVDAADGSPLGEGVLYYRPDRTLAFAFHDPTDGVEGHRAVFYDEAGNVVQSEDAASGRGLARPWLPIVFRRDLSGGIDPEERTTTSSTFADMWIADFARTHTKVRWAFYARASDATTAGEARLWHAGRSEQVGSTITIAAGSYTTQVIEGTLPVGWADYDIESLRLQARRTAGTGTIGLAVLSAYAKQT